jgi:hypothetical protein
VTSGRLAIRGFTAEKPLILELSKLCDMTRHHQAAAHARITC